MISTHEMMGGAKSLVLDPGTTYKMIDRERWLHVVCSGSPNGPGFMQFPVTDHYPVGAEYTISMLIGTTNQVEFRNGRGDRQTVYGRDGTPRQNADFSSGYFGSYPIVRAKLIATANGGTWTIWSVGDPF
jgi:hypothetical protein